MTADLIVSAVRNGCAQIIFSFYAVQDRNQCHLSMHMSCALFSLLCYCCGKVIKYPNKSNVREKVLMLAYSCQGMRKSIMRKTWEDLVTATVVWLITLLLHSESRE